MTGCSHIAQKAACSPYGINAKTYQARIRRGFTHEEAITRPLEYTKNHDFKAEAVALGFASVKDMCAAHGISPGIYGRRRRNGQSPETALSVAPQRPKNYDFKAEAIAHGFQSLDEMCKAHGISKKTYTNRRRTGKSTEESLAASPRVCTREPIDFKAEAEVQGFPSIEDMCAAYSITVAAYRQRRAKGLSPEEALSAAEHQYTICTDAAGRRFPSRTCMRKFFGTRESKVTEKAIISQWTARDCGRYHVDRCVNFPWFIGRISGNEVVVHFDTLLNEFHTLGPDPLENLQPPMACIKPLERLAWPMYHVRLNDGTEAEMDYWSIMSDWIQRIEKKTAAVRAAQIGENK